MQPLTGVPRKMDVPIFQKCKKITFKNTCEGVHI